MKTKLRVLTSSIILAAAAALILVVLILWFLFGYDLTAVPAL